MPKIKYSKFVPMMLEAHKLCVKKAIEITALTNTSLVVADEKGKIRNVKPDYRIVRVPLKPKRKKIKT